MRRAFDFYPTPEWATRILIDYIPPMMDRIVFDPCSGDGSMMKIIKEEYPYAGIFRNDIDKSREADHRLDATFYKNWEVFPTCHWVITNPPFNGAHRILTSAYKKATEGVALLIRLSFLEPTFDRQDFLSEFPPTRLVVLPRIDLNGTETYESITTAWMIWDKKDESKSIQVVRK